MDVREARNVIRQLIKSPGHLQQATIIVDKQIQNKGFLLSLGMIATDPDIEPAEQLLAALILKYIASEYWVTAKLKSNEKNTIKQIVLEKIIDVDSKIAFHLGVMLGIVGEHEFFQPRQDTSVLEGVLETLENEREGEGLDGVLEALFVMLRDSDQKYTRFAARILATLFTAFVSAEGNESRRSKCLFLVYLCLRSFAWADGSENDLVAKCLDDTFSSWMALIVSIFQTNPKSNFEIKRNALRVLVVLIRDFVTYTHSALNMILEPVWKLLTIHLPIYIHTVCYERPLERLSGDPKLSYIMYPFIDTTSFEDDEPGVEGMTRQLIDLITTLIANPAIHTLIRTGLGPFISTLCSYLLLPQSQLEFYKHNPLYFIEDSDQYTGEGLMEASDNIRSLCARILETLIEIFGTSTIDTLQNIALDSINFTGTIKKPPQPSAKKPMSAYDSVSIYEYITEAYDKHEVWRKNELGLYLLAFLSDDLFVAVEKGQKFVNVSKIVDALNKSCRNPAIFANPLLLGRLLCAGSESIQLFPKVHPLPTQLIEVSYVTLKGNYADSVKYIACKCLVRCAHHLQGLPLKDVAGLIKHVQRMQPECELENLHILTETIATVFIYGDPKSLVPLLGEIIGSYLKVFIDNEEDAREFIDLVQKLSKQPHYSLQLLRATLKVPNPDLSEYALSQLLDLLNMLAAKCNPEDPVYESFLSVLPILISKTHSSLDDQAFVVTSTSCIRTIIAYGHKLFHSGSKKHLVGDVLKLCERLLDPSCGEISCINVGYLLLHIFEKLTPKISTELLMAIVQKVYKSRMPSVVQSLAALFALLLLKKPKEMLGLLTETSVDNRISLKILLDRWLLHQPLFRGTFTKAITYSALLQLFTIKDPRVEALMVITYNPSHSNVNSEVNAPFKILCTLLRCIDNLANAKVVKPKDILDEAQELLKPRPGGMDGGDGRLDTEGDQDDDYFSDKPGGLVGAIDVEMDRVEEEEVYGAMGEKMFHVGESKDRGLADLEVGSACYMSEMLNFNFDDYDDCEEMKEDDLIALHGPLVKHDLKSYLVKGLKEVIAKDKEYFTGCYMYLLKQDQQLAKKYLSFK